MGNVAFQDAIRSSEASPYISTNLITFWPHKPLIPSSISVDVSLDFIGASPIKIAEWALASVHVFVPHMSLDFPNSSEDSIALHTVRPCLASGH